MPRFLCRCVSCAAAMSLLALLALLAALDTSAGWVVSDMSARAAGGVVNALSPGAAATLLAASAVDETGVGARDLLLFSYGSPFGVTLAYSAFPGDTIGDIGASCALLCELFNTGGQQGGGVGAGSIHFWEAEAAWCHATPTQTLLGGGPGAYHWCACLQGAIPVPVPNKPAGCLLLGTTRGTPAGCRSGEATRGVWDALSLRWGVTDSAAVLRSVMSQSDPLTSGMAPLPQWLPAGTLPGECVCASWAAGAKCDIDRRPNCAVAAGCVIRNTCWEPSNDCTSCVAGWAGPGCSLPTCIETFAAWASAPLPGAAGARCGGRGVGHCGSSTDATLCECTAGGDPASGCARLLTPSRRTRCYSPSPKQVGEFWAIPSLAAAECSGHGACYGVDKCVCTTGWSGPYCATALPTAFACTTKVPRVGGCRYTLPAGNTNASSACGTGVFLLQLPPGASPPAVCVSARGRLASTIDLGAVAPTLHGTYRNGAGTQSFLGTGNATRVHCVLPLCYVAGVDTVPPSTALRVITG